MQTVLVFEGILADDDGLSLVNINSYAINIGKSVALDAPDR